jgi:hypothetical protein
MPECRLSGYGVKGGCGFEEFIDVALVDLKGKRPDPHSFYVGV